MERGEKKRNTGIHWDTKKENKANFSRVTHLVSLNIRGSVAPGFVIASEIP